MNELRQSNQTGELTIILDNTGLEFVADLCFAVFCLSRQLFTKVNFHVKKIPWFVSDVTAQDFKWTLDQMRTNDSNDAVLKRIAEKCQDYLDNGQFEIVEEVFWTSPLPYHVMSKEVPELYHKLSQSKLLVFKGTNGHYFFMRECLYHGIFDYRRFELQKTRCRFKLATDYSVQRASPRF